MEWSSAADSNARLQVPTTATPGNLKIISADFVTSAAAGGTSTGIPRDGLPQIVMAGRSNVGKSTLINALLRRQVARTSAAPGKTRLANIFRITVEGGGPGRWNLYLVDLPGYGYARGGADAAQELAGVAEAYFREMGTATFTGRRRPRRSRSPLRFCWWTPGTRGWNRTSRHIRGCERPASSRSSWRRRSTNSRVPNARGICGNSNGSLENPRCRYRPSAAKDWKAVDNDSKTGQGRGPQGQGGNEGTTT